MSTKFKYQILKKQSQFYSFQNSTHCRSTVIEIRFKKKTVCIHHEIHFSLNMILDNTEITFALPECHHQLPLSN